MVSLIPGPFSFDHFQYARTKGKDLVYCQPIGRHAEGGRPNERLFRTLATCTLIGPVRKGLRHALLFKGPLPSVYLGNQFKVTGTNS